MITVELIAAWTLGLVGVGSAISAAEELARPRLWRDGGPRSWRLGQLRLVALVRLADSRVGGVMSDQATWAVHVGQLALACASIVAGLFGTFIPELAIGLSALKLVLLVRTPYGHDGADQMLLLLCVVLGLGSLDRFLTDRTTEFVLWFIAAQAVLAYVASGLVKLSDRAWRSGHVASAVLQTATYGSPEVGRWLKSRPIADRAATYGVMTIEVGAILLLLGIGWLTLLLVIALGLFHATNAIAMGLDTFLWAFVATYPSVLWALG